MKILNFLIILLISSNILCQVTISNPHDLVQIFKQKHDGSKILYNQDIGFKLGNFGEIPVGKTLVKYS